MLLITMLHLNVPDVLSFSFPYLSISYSILSHACLSFYTLSRSFFSTIVIEGDDIFQKGAFVTDTVQNMI
jgi:hypothetical protein